MFGSDDMAKAKAAIAALDFTAENERLAELERKIEEAGKAQNEARRRMDALAGHRADEERMQSAQVADALIAGADDLVLDVPAKSPEQRNAEREAIIAGVRELSMRIARMESEKLQIHHEAKRKVADAARALSDMVLEKARQRAAALIESYAELKALSVATDRLVRETAAAQNAARALRHDNGLAVRANMLIEVPAAIIEALAPLQGAGPALPGSKYGPMRSVDV